MYRRRTKTGRIKVVPIGLCPLLDSIKRRVQRSNMVYSKTELRMENLVRFSDRHPMFYELNQEKYRETFVFQAAQLFLCRNLAFSHLVSVLYEMYVYKSYLSP